MLRETRACAQTLNIAGLGHTSVSCVGRYTDRVGYVLARLTVGWGSFWPASSSLREGVPPGFNPPRKGLGLSPGAPEMPLFRWMPTVPVAFLGMVGVSAPGTHLKKAFCRLVRRKTNTDTCVRTVYECRWAGIHLGWPCWSVHRSGRMCPSSVGSRSRPPDTDSKKPAFMSDAPWPGSLILRKPSSHYKNMNKKPIREIHGSSLLLQ